MTSILQIDSTYPLTFESNCSLILLPCSSHARPRLAAELGHAELQLLPGAFEGVPGGPDVAAEPAAVGPARSGTGDRDRWSQVTCVARRPKNSSAESPRIKAARRISDFLRNTAKDVTV